MSDQYDMTIAEFAMAIGVSRQAVYKAAKEGRIIVKDGKVNSALAKRMWSEGNPASEKSGLNNDEILTAAVTSFKNNRAIRERYEAQIRKLEYEEKAGKVIEIKRVQDEAFRASRIVRDKMFAVSIKVVPLLVGKTDIREMTEILDSAIRDALTGLADLFDGLAK